MRSGLQWKASVDVYLSSLTTVKIIVIIVGKSQINSTKQPHHSNLHVQKLRRDLFLQLIAQFICILSSVPRGRNCVAS